MTVTVAVLAGGLGSRIGGDKALVQLRGRPLIAYPLAAARIAGFTAVVVAKQATRLPELHERVLIEPDEPTHPLCGLVTAVRELGSVLAVPCDMPFVSASLLERLAGTGGQVVVPSRGQPFPGLYTFETVRELEWGLAHEASMRVVLADLRAHELDDVDPELLFSINTPEDLEAAERRLSPTH